MGLQPGQTKSRRRMVVEAASRLLLGALLVVFLGAGCRKPPQLGVSTPVPNAPPAPLAPPPVLNPAAPLSAPALSGKPEVDRRPQVVVLGYHRFVNQVRHPGTEITPADFEAQLTSLRENGVKVIGMEDFLAWRRGEKALPPKCALITVDDGYKSVFTVAWPLLKKFGYPFTLFIYTDYVRGGPRSGGDSLSWEQLAEMRDAGVSIQSHTISHRDLRGRKGRAQQPAYEPWLWNELRGSKDLIESRLGVQVAALALPYGFQNEHVREIARKAGYELIFTVNGQPVDFATPAEAIGRFMIEADKPKIFAQAVGFPGARGQEAEAGLVQELAVRSDPADGASQVNPGTAIRASLEGFGEVDPQSVTMRLSGVGSVPARFDPATKTLSYEPPKPLPPAKYTVIVGANSKGKKVQARWSFSVEPASPPSVAARMVKGS